MYKGRSERNDNSIIPPKHLQLFHFDRKNFFFLFRRYPVETYSYIKMFDFFPRGMCDTVTLEVRVLEGALLMALSLLVCGSCSKAACFPASLNILN